MLSTFSGLPRTAWVIFAGTVVNRLGYLVAPFLVFYLGARGIPSHQVPLVLGALGAGNLIGPMVGGLLADQVGRRPTILAGLLGTAFAQGLLFVAPNVVTLAIAAILLSAAGSMVSPAANAVLTDTVTAEQRRTVFALSHWAVNIGTAVAGILGGFLATHGYWMLFTVDALSSLAYAVIVVAMLPSPQRRDQAVTTGDGIGYGVVFRDPLMRMLLPLSAVGLVIYSLTEVCLPLAIRDHGLPATTYGLMATLNAILVVVLQPVATRITARIPQIPVYVAASIVTSIGVALTGMASGTWSFAGTVVVWSIGEATVSGIAGGIIAGLAPDHARGRYQGSYLWTWGIGRFLALGVGTAIYADLNPAAVWWFSLVGGVAASLGIGALGPAINRRLAVPDAVPALELEIEVPCPPELAAA